jgi:hypothetical protein
MTKTEACVPLHIREAVFGRECPEKIPRASLPGTLFRKRQFGLESRNWAAAA